jgi:hypothetical protein
MSPGHGHAYTQANGFAESFFHRKTRRQKTHPAVGPTGASGSKGLHLGLTQYLLGKALTMAIKGGADAAYIANIGTYAENLAHGLRQSK